MHVPVRAQIQILTMLDEWDIERSRELHRPSCYPCIHHGPAIVRYGHDASFFHRTLKYVERQRDLARVQAQSVRELGLPRWMYVYSIARHGYAYFPPGWKRFLRRALVGSRERDV